LLQPTATSRHTRNDSNAATRFMHTSPKNQGCSQ
jgi:hypothetical protein